MDTDVVLAAMRSPSGASAALLRLALESRITILASVALALEYEEVCHRAEHRLATGLAFDQVEEFVDGIIALAEPVEAHFRWRPSLRDPCDEMVLEAAVNGRADMLVTFNIRDFQQVPSVFGIVTMRPAEALRRIRV